MSLERLELSQFAPAAEFHLPQAGEGYMQLCIGHIAFGITQTPEAPYGVRIGEVPIPANDELQLGVQALGVKVQNVLPYRDLPRMTQPVDLVRGQIVDFGRYDGVMLKSPNDVRTRQTDILVDNALATAVRVDSGISAVHAKLFVADRGIVSLRHHSRSNKTVVTLEEGTPAFVEPTPAPRFR